MAIVKVKEIIGTSPNSFEEAFQNAIAHACEEKKNVTGAKIISQTATIEEGRVVEYKVNVKIAYRWEKEFHQ
jgi:hypothetical protein